MRGYWTYYLGWIVLMYVLRSPWLLLGIVAFLALRRVIPDPGVVLGTWGRIRTLRGQIEANAANVSARRDLARIYIARKRPGRAISLLDEALGRHPDDAELLFLKGLAEHRRGKHEAALGPLVRAVEIDARVGFGEPYLIAGDALLALGRLAEAEDAFARFVEANGSSIEGQLKLARTLSRAGKRDEATQAVDEALGTYAQLPAYARRKQLGWWLRSQLAKATIQRRPGAIFIVLCALAATCFLGLLVFRGVRADLGSRNGVLPRTFGIQRFLPPAPPKSRFVRVEPSRGAGSQLARFRSPPKPEEAYAPALADFACRIWSLYGPPDPGTDQDFAFTFEDTSTGVVFVATSQTGFAAYAVTPVTRAKAPVTLEAFDALLDISRPVDCSVQVTTEDGPIRYAVQGGRPVVVGLD